MAEVVPRSVDVVVKIGVGGAVEILGQRGCKMTSTRAKIDLTVKADYPNKKYAYSWHDASIDFDGLLHVAGSLGFAALMTTQMNETLADVQITDTASGESFAGKGILTDINFDAPYDKEPTMSGKIEKSGAWTITQGV